jgi:two-component system, NtrC family, response regulator HydG
MNPKNRIMVVDDEEAMRESLSAWLVKEGYQADQAESGPQALSLLAEREYDLLLVDIKMPGMDGLELLGEVREKYPQTLVIIITAYGSIESAVTAMKSGASDYLLKPVDPEQMILVIEKTLQHHMVLEENRLLRERLAEREQIIFEDLVSCSPSMLEIFKLIEEVAPAEAPVLISGETGTGKELIARAIHSRGSRSFGPFVAINCGAQSESLLESELFGHEKGAFTGAIKTRRGRIEMADGGTLFLDEVGDIPLKMQVDLLRVLEEKRFFRVGGSQSITSDFRLVCASHQDLALRIRAGQFRQDFFYRINVISLQIPPLRERKEDIPILADFFLQQFARETGKQVTGVTPEGLQALRAYDWPGNVRELKNVIERAVVISRGPWIGDRELTFLQLGKEMTEEMVTLEEMEAHHLRRTLDRLNWNLTQSAKTLAIDRGTLLRKVKKFGLTKPSP